MDELPKASWDGIISLQPESTLQERKLLQDGKEVEQVLIYWAGTASEDYTGEDPEYIRTKFPHFNSGDQVVARG